MQKSTIENTSVKTADKKADSKINKVVTSWDEFNSSKFPLISAISENNIFLYGIKPAGVVLYVGEDKGFYYDWTYLTPRFILPRMYLRDFDNDGKDELAVVLYVGSGTQFSVDELHIVRISEKERISEKPDENGFFPVSPEYFKDYSFFPDDYLSQLKQSITFKTFTESGELKGIIKVGGKSFAISLKDFQSIGYGKIREDLAYGDIVHFGMENNQLTATFSLGVMGEKYATSKLVGDLIADVDLKNGKFILNNYRFKKYDEK